MFTWFRQRFRSRRIQPRIELAPDGFDIVGADNIRHRVRWTRVIKIVAYKRDLITTDEIVLAFEESDRPGIAQEASEEWIGFADLFGAMEEHLQVTPAWYAEVMTPAFEPNVRVLYDRSSSPALDNSGDAAG